MKTGPFLEVNLIYQHPVLLDGLSLKNTVKEKTLAVTLTKSDGLAAHEGAESQAFRWIQKMKQTRGEGIELNTLFIFWRLSGQWVSVP